MSLLGGESHKNHPNMLIVETKAENAMKTFTNKLHTQRDLKEPRTEDYIKQSLS